MPVSCVVAEDLEERSVEFHLCSMANGQSALCLDRANFFNMKQNIEDMRTWILSTKAACTDEENVNVSVVQPEADVFTDRINWPASPSGSLPLW